MVHFITNVILDSMRCDSSCQGQYSNSGLSDSHRAPDTTHFWRGESGHGRSRCERNRPGKAGSVFKLRPVQAELPGTAPLLSWPLNWK